MASKIFNIIRKNLKILLRTRISSLIVIVGPILLFLLAGIAFNNNESYEMKIGVFSEQWTDVSRDFLNEFSESGAQIIEMSSDITCIESIKESSVHACVVFPRAMTLENNNATQDIIFYADYSKINFVYNIIDSISTKLSTKSSELSVQLTEVLLEKLKSSQLEIKTNNPIALELKSKNDENYNSLNSIKSNLDKLSFDFSPASSTDLLTDYSAMDSHFQNSVTDSKSILNNIEDIIEGSSANSSDIAAVSDLIDEAKGKLSNYTRDFDAAYVSLDAKSSSMSSTYTDLTGKLNTAKTAVTTSQTDMSTIVTNLNDGKSKLQSIIDSNKRIIDDINNIKVTNSENIVSPFNTIVQPVVSQGSKLSNIFPSILVLVVMLIGILLGTISVIMEKKSRAYFRNFISPTADSTFVIGSFLTNFLIIFLQVALVLSLSQIFFEINFLNNYLNSGILIILIISLFVLIGMFIGYFFESEETGTLAAVSLFGLMLFISDVILPLESIPSYLVKYAKFNPFVLTATMLKRTLLFEHTLKGMLSQLYLLISIIILIYCIILIKQKIVRKRMLSRSKHREIKYDVEKLSFEGKVIDSVEKYVNYISKMTSSDYVTFYKTNKKQILFWLKQKLDKTQFKQIKKKNTKEDILIILESCLKPEEKIEKIKTEYTSKSKEDVKEQKTSKHKKSKKDDVDEKENLAEHEHKTKKGEPDDKEHESKATTSESKVHTVIPQEPDSIEEAEKIKKKLQDNQNK